MADENDAGTAVSSDERVERGIRFVAAEPQAIFDLLADPTQHALIDGSGTVRAATSEVPERLSLGAKFSMSMKKGVAYKITNEVVEFDEPSVIAWRHVGRHVWRYRLRPVDGGTEVTEEFDWGVARLPSALRLTGITKKNGQAIEATLDRLAAHFATD
ncbi:MAG TPA: SRPBCC family protein [Ilumatobacteraceae bacterium]|nr:SRPBCC family protein [Ilumatobacteraceae bacterium]